MVFWAFAFGAIVGGVFGLVMILIRRQLGANARMVREIGKDLKMFATGKVGEAAKRAEDAEGVGEAALRHPAVRRLPAVPVVRARSLMA